MTRTLVSCPSCRGIVGHRRARSPGRGPLLRVMPGVGAIQTTENTGVVVVVCRCGHKIAWSGDVAIRPRDAPVPTVV